jgi:hypothetical protein
MPGNAFDAGWSIIGNAAQFCLLDIFVADVEGTWWRFPLNTQK